MNINGVTYWKTSAGANTANSSLTNCIFYNSNKVTLTGHHIAQTYTRDIDVYDFKLNSNNAITFTCIIAHLKAGSSSDDKEKRRIMALNTMNYLANYYRDKNVLIMGDFNLYSSNEPAYQTLTNQTSYPDAYFIDPLYPYGVGEWNNNSSYRDYHTQSTHSDNNGCASYGGMDDRFDFILMSESIYGGSKGVHYVGGSYLAIGQDGMHFNQSINSNGNYAVSQTVADALYNNSDHLPVKMELTCGYQNVNELNTNTLSLDIFPNPAKEKINIRFYQDNIGKANILLFNTLGQMVYSDAVMVQNNLSEYAVPVENLTKGLYFLKITNVDGLSETIKVVVE